MEHPVPQNITSFEFHLVGDMTLKQFGFLASGCTLAYLTFLTLFSRSPSITLILMALFAISGALFAFIPISNRPLDHWVLAFFKAVYSPTIGWWENPFSKSKIQDTDPVFTGRLQNYLTSYNLEISAPKLIPLPPLPGSSPAPLPKLIRLTQPVQPIVQPKPIIPQATFLENQTILNLTRQIQILQDKIIQEEKELAFLKTQQTKPQNIVQTSANLQSLVKQEQKLAKQTAAITIFPPSKFQAKTPIITIAEKPRMIQKSLLLTSLPNVVNGAITDLSGNYLENVIVIIHNQEGVPVRASKTNKLGQFLGATPLPAGQYNVTFEKEGLSFATLKINLNNEIIPALNIQPMKGNI